MQSILDPHATLSVLNVGEIYTSRDQIINAAKTAVAQYGVKNVRILSTEAKQTDTVITVSMAILSDHDNAAVSMINTGWQFDWQKMGGKWSLVRIVNLKIGNESGDRAASRMPKTP